MLRIPDLPGQTSFLPKELKCQKCHAIKPEADFERQGDGKAGRHPWCKDCVNATGKPE